MKLIEFFLVSPFLTLFFFLLTFPQHVLLSSFIHFHLLLLTIFVPFYVFVLKKQRFANFCQAQLSVLVHFPILLHCDELFFGFLVRLELGTLDGPKRGHVCLSTSILLLDLVFSYLCKSLLGQLAFF
jgi:hypothetical protein